MEFYYEKHANLIQLRDKTIALIGYTDQGINQALSMREAGLNVILALEKNDKNWENAKKAGFEILSLVDAIRQADIVHFLSSDDQEETDLSFFPTSPETEHTLLGGKTFTQIELSVRK